MTYYCTECDEEILIEDEPPWLCYYTGRPCEGPCDCSATYRTVCADCAEDNERAWPLASFPRCTECNEPFPDHPDHNQCEDCHDWRQCDCRECTDEAQLHRSRLTEEGATL